MKIVVLLTTEGHLGGPAGRSCRDTSARHNLREQKGKKTREPAGRPDLVCWQGRRSQHYLNSVNTNQKV